MYLAIGQSVRTEDMSIGVRHADIVNAKDQPDVCDGHHVCGVAQGKE